MDFEISEQEIFDAYRKLQSYIYFDNNDLKLRRKLAEFKEKNDSDISGYLRKLAGKINNDDFKVFAKYINVYYIPKKIEGISERPLNSNFYSNVNFYEGAKISSVSIFCDLSIDLHIIAVLWIIKYGQVVDSRLSKSTFGNRLSLHDEKLGHGRALFKPYQGQFQKWWGKAIDATQHLINNNDNATIVNFDLKDFYHRVRVNIDKCAKDNYQGDDNIDLDPLHKLFLQIHVIYKEKVAKIDHDAFRDFKENEFPLPISALSSPIIANWALKSLDEYVEKELKPVYYGRYVDDVMLVFKNTILEDKHFKHTKNINIKEDGNLIYLNTHLNNLFEEVVDSEDDIYFLSSDKVIDLEGYENLILQKNKLFIYQFDSDFSPSLIGKFVQEQKERSSEFRFLADSSDDNFNKFENNIFESSFDIIETNKAKFKNIEDNKFKLSVFLSKLISRRIQNGDGYRDEEIDKVSKFFKGYNSLKYYFFWEKIFTLFVVANRKDLILEFISEIDKEIKKKKVKVENLNVDKLDNKLDTFFSDHLNEALSMSLGLNLSLLFGNSKDANNPKKLLLNKLKDKRNFYNVFPDFEDYDDSEIYSFLQIYRRHSLLRKYYSGQPLVHLLMNVKKNDFSLTDLSIWKFIYFKDEQDLFYDDSSELALKIPYRVKFYEIVIFYLNVVLKLETKSPSIIHKQWWNDIMNSEKILIKSFDLFWQINNDGLPYYTDADKNKVRNEYFEIYKDASEKANIESSCKGERFPKYKNRNYYINQIKVNKNKYKKDDVRVAIINKYINFRDFEASLKGSPNITTETIQTFNDVLDQVSKIKNCDLFVLPELSVPHELVYNICRHSVAHQVGFTTGIEHIRVGNIGYNLILTFLPIKVNGDEIDGVPIFRLKNHYSPAEEQLLLGHKMIVPKPNPYRYDLFIWRGFNFSNSYCYELADVYHRVALYGKIDFLVAPIWNPDMPYYDSIVDSTVRDMHCHIIQVNTSQYGGSRITRPTDSLRKNKAFISGGTTKEHKFNILVGDLEIKKLREFQLLDFTAQKDLNKDKKSYKPTPPDYPTQNVEKRIKGNFFKRR